MANPTTQEFTTLIEQFVKREIPVSTFERAYLEMFKNDEGLHPDEEFTVLDSLCADVDAFTADAALRTSGDLDEEGLRARAKRALESLGEQQVAGSRSPTVE